jgi:hypothetical protein
VYSISITTSSLFSSRVPWNGVVDQRVVLRARAGELNGSAPAFAVALIPAVDHPGGNKQAVAVAQTLNARDEHLGRAGADSPTTGRRPRVTSKLVLKPDSSFALKV